MPKRNVAWMLVMLVIALLLWQLPQLIAERDSIIRSFGTLAEIRTEIHRRAIEPIDDDVMVRSAVDAAAAKMIESLNDPHARYLNPQAFERFRDRAEGLVGGIGIEVAVIDEQLAVINVRGGTPAASAGLAKGDLILEIDGEPMVSMDLIEAAHLLTGEPGTPIHLTVQTPGAVPRELDMNLATLRLNPVRGFSRAADGHWRYLIDAAAGIGYVRLTEFVPNAASELDQAIETIRREGARAWILDLRENRGGLLTAAIDVADRFLSSGDIVSTRGARGPSAAEQTWSAQFDGTYANLPMVVLVNAWSASSAEIVAGALRDNRRATLIGTRTYGKGSVQELINLRDGGAIKITTRYYFLPNGTCIQKRPGPDGANQPWGVEPHIVVDMSAEQREQWLDAWLTATWVDGASRSATTPATQHAVDDRAPVGDGDADIVLDKDPQLQRGIVELRRMLGVDSEMSASRDGR
jgi:carboxyl-terminal processing protease